MDLENEGVELTVVGGSKDWARICKGSPLKMNSRRGEPRITRQSEKGYKRGEKLGSTGRLEAELGKLGVAPNKWRRIGRRQKAQRPSLGSLLGRCRNGGFGG